VLQQIPATQNPDAHSAFRVHAAPPMTWQRPVLSHAEPGQSASVVQLVRQVALAGSHRYGAQMTAGPARHAPRPSQTFCPTTALPSHEPAAQTVPMARRRQAPAPSHVPSFPQVNATSTGQAPAVRGGLPLGTAPQTPTLPAVLQRMQSPVQAVLQQTPSAQKAVTHSSANRHGWPIALISIGGRSAPMLPPPPPAAPAAPLFAAPAPPTPSSPAPPPPAPAPLADAPAMPPPSTPGASSVRLAHPIEIVAPNAIAIIPAKHDRTFIVDASVHDRAGVAPPAQREVKRHSPAVVD
jgi:hypothetical protein